jgi:hypothetical protein
MVFLFEGQSDRVLLGKESTRKNRLLCGKGWRKAAQALENAKMLF